MKKLRSVVLVTILSTTLVGNVFAVGSGGSGFFSFFDLAVSSAVSFFLSGSGDDNCPVRTCGGCKPGGPDCRPPER